MKEPLSSALGLPTVREKSSSRFPAGHKNTRTRSIKTGTGHFGALTTGVRDAEHRRGRGSRHGHICEMQDDSKETGQHGNSIQEQSGSQGST